MVAQRKRETTGQKLARWRAHWREVTRLQLLQVRVSTNEPGEPLWPRSLTPRGAYMLGTAFVAVLIGVSYLVPSGAEVATTAPVRAVLPPAAYASMWIVAGALVLCLGPTKWWHYGLVAVAGLHGGWAAASLISWLQGESDRGWVLALLYGHGALACVTAILMLNPPRRQHVELPTGPDGRSGTGAR